MENERLRQEIEQLRQREKQLEQERERLHQENEKLKRQLDEAQRASKRQAAPFSRGRRKSNPQPPGRKSGTAYGQRHHKPIPEQVDEVIAVPLRWAVLLWGRAVAEKIVSQFQHEIVRQTIWRRFDIAIGRCTVCHQRVQGRDRRQTSDALGAAAVQLGPEALALGVKMNKALGMPHADVGGGPAGRLWLRGEPQYHLPRRGSGGPARRSDLACPAGRSPPEHGERRR